MKGGNDLAHVPTPSQNNTKSMLSSRSVTSTFSREELGEEDVLLRKAKMEVKEMNNDITLLRNRVHHLKAELCKAEKSVHETKVRTEEIKQAKLKNKEKKIFKEKLIEDLHGETSEKTKQIKQRQQEDREKRLKKKEEHRRKLREDAILLKQERRKIKAKQSEAKTASEREALERVKQMREAMEEKRRKQEEQAEAEKQERLEKAREELRDRKRGNAKALLEIERLEAVETDWINKLKEIQIRQSEAYEHLETVLAQQVD